MGVAGLGDAAGSHGAAIAGGLFSGLILQGAHEKLSHWKWLPAPLPLAMAAMLDMGTCSALALGGLLSLYARGEKEQSMWSAMICADAMVMVVLLYFRG